MHLYKDSYFYFSNSKYLNAPRNIGKYLVIIGSIIAVLGIIFTLQSKSVVGPESSFMYQNPEWTVNGYFILSVGVIIIIFGIVLSQIQKSNRKFLK